MIYVDDNKNWGKVIPKGNEKWIDRYLTNGVEVKYEVVTEDKCGNQSDGVVVYATPTAFVNTISEGVYVYGDPEDIIPSEDDDLAVECNEGVFVITSEYAEDYIEGIYTYEEIASLGLDVEIDDGDLSNDYFYVVFKEEFVNTARDMKGNNDTPEPDDIIVIEKSLNWAGRVGKYVN
jgi:hypothetical protein